MTWDGTVINEVENVITNGDAMVFIIRTKGEDDYWWWEVSRSEWNNYWERENNPGAIVSSALGSTNKANAVQFANDLDNTNLGCSCGSYKTVLDAIKGYEED